MTFQYDRGYCIGPLIFACIDAGEFLAGGGGLLIVDFFAHAGGGGGGALGSGATALERGAQSASNRALHEMYTDDLRAAMEKPSVSDADLGRMLSILYRDGATIGSGSTAAAVRYTKRTGELVGNSDHLQKANDYISALKNWLTANPNASSADRAAAENVIKDMQKALEHP